MGASVCDSAPFPGKNSNLKMHFTRCFMRLDESEVPLAEITILIVSTLHSQT